jgi:hypothetical protein
VPRREPSGSALRDWLEGYMVGKGWHRVKGAALPDLWTREELEGPLDFIDAVARQIARERERTASR